MSEAQHLLKLLKQCSEQTLQFHHRLPSLKRTVHRRDVKECSRTLGKPRVLALDSLEDLLNHSPDHGFPLWSRVCGTRSRCHVRDVLALGSTSVASKASRFSRCPRPERTSCPTLMSVSFRRIRSTASAERGLSVRRGREIAQITPFLANKGKRAAPRLELLFNESFVEAASSCGAWREVRA